MAECPESLAEAWRGAQADLWHVDGAGRRWLTQPGGWLLPDVFDLPLYVPGDPVDPGWQSEPQIETFTVDVETADCTPMGDGRAVDWWAQTVQRLARTVQAAVGSVGVDLEGVATVTASITDVAEVNAEPHVDDACSRPQAGVGVVAIVGTVAGPQALTGSVAMSADQDLDNIDPALWEDLGRLSGDDPNGTAQRLRYPPNRIVLFAQFGQVHAGPSASDLAAADAFGRRSLLVYRAATVPQLGGSPT